MKRIELILEGERDQLRVLQGEREWVLDDILRQQARLTEIDQRQRELDESIAQLEGLVGS